MEAQTDHEEQSVLVLNVKCVESPECSTVSTGVRLGSSDSFQRVVADATSDLSFASSLELLACIADRKGLRPATAESSYNPRSLPERTLREAKLLEFGAVTFPAYEGATAGVRSLTDGFIQQEAA